MGVTPARRAAYRVLRRVETDLAYASELLHASSELKGLDERDRALATEIVLGCLRWQGSLDDLVRRASRRPVEKIDAEVRTALRMGAYQLRHLERIPARAAISQTVDQVKLARKRSAAAFVNAVLHALPEREPSGKEHELAHPAWLVRRWLNHFGIAATRRILAHNLATPATYLRLHVGFDMAETLDRLRQQGVETTPTELPACRLVLSGKPTATECFAEGRIHIQDLGSQTIIPFLGLAPGQHFLDLCAAPGGKTHQALETVGGDLRTVAADRHRHRLGNMRRLTACPSPMIVLDGEQALPFHTRFDRILVDAPCSGTGTLARNPEIKWRLAPQDLLDLGHKQKNILSRALDTLASGGILVYSTCSLEPEENRQVIDAVLREKTGFVVDEYLERVPGREAGDGFFACRVRSRLR